MTQYQGPPIEGDENFLQRVLPPLTSLLSKSEKVLRGLPRDSWQHQRLVANVRALRLSVQVLSGDIGATEIDPDARLETLNTLHLLCTQVEKVLDHFAPDSAQYALQRNRLNALRVAAQSLAASSP